MSAVLKTERDPLASNTDPTDEELRELVKSAFAPGKIGMEKARVLHLERLREAVRQTNDCTL